MTDNQAFLFDFEEYRVGRATSGDEEKKKNSQCSWNSKPVLFVDGLKVNLVIISHLCD